MFALMSKRLNMNRLCDTCPVEMCDKGDLIC